MGLTGWIAKEDEKGVTIANEWLPDQDIAHSDYRGTHFIPRGMIERVEYWP